MTRLAKEKIVYPIVTSEIKETMVGSMTVTNAEYQHFTVVTESIEGRRPRKTFSFFDDSLRNHIRSWTGDSSLYYENGKINVDLVLRHINKLRSFVKNHDQQNFVSFAAVLEEEFKGTQKAVDAMLANGEIDYGLLWYVFDAGKVVSFNDGEEWSGGEIVNYEYQSSMWSGNKFLVKVKMVATDGKNFVNVVRPCAIREFEGSVKLSLLPVKLMDDNLKAELIERGRLYQRVANGAQYLHFSGELVRRGYWSSNFYKAEGRVMVDLLNMKRVDPNYWRNSPDIEENDGDAVGFESIPEEMLYATTPIVYGFSFACKKWGEMRVSKMKEIDFRDDAFDKLVLDADKKKMMLALVKNAESGFTDIISGKGGGCIFLLHGGPGLGKTLTAEAIAEVMHRPLYSVSIGELGVEPNELEERLRVVLDMASSWNAVLLLDEADIFVEERGDHDIIRNAMVGIFLRLLEYHQGVMFLTTNRAKSIDPAMRSRIAIALKYEEHQSVNRAAIWTNLLNAANVTTVDPKRLCHYDLNGREIKTSIRLAQAIAKEDGVDVSEEHIISFIDLKKEFSDDMKA